MVLELPGLIATFVWLIIAFQAGIFAVHAWSYNRSAVVYIFPLLVSSLLVATACFFSFSSSANWVALGFGVVVVGYLMRPSTFRNYAELLRVYKVMREEVKHWHSMANQAFEGIFHLDPETYRYLDVNPSGCLALGYNLEEMKANTVETIHPESYALVKKHVGEVISTGKPRQIQVWASTKSGKRKYVDITLSRFKREGKEIILATGRDLTPWILKNEQVAHINRLYEILTLSNRAIAQVTHRGKLLERIADLIVEEGRFKLAWIAHLDGSKILPEYIAGPDRKYVEELSLDMENPELIHSPVINAFRQHQVICVNAIQSNPNFKRYWECAVRMGVSAITALPIMVGNRVDSVMAIYSEKEFAFDDKTKDLLANLADDLSRALVNIEVNEQRQRNAMQLKKLSSAVDQSADAIMILSSEGAIEYINPKFERLTGYSSGEVLGRRPTLLCFDEDEVQRYEQMLSDLKKGRQWKGEVHYRRRDQSDYWSKDVLTPIRDSEGHIVNFVSTSEDFTALREAQKRISELAFYDPLTGLPNKRLVIDRIRQSIKASFGEPWNVAVFFVDLDRFKAINDSMGHQVGDAVLKQVAGRFQGVLGTDDTVARLGADEFVVVLSKVTHVREIVHVGERLMEVLSAPIVAQSVTTSLSASAGVTVSPTDGTDAEDLIRKADLAMYHAKSSGRNHFQFYMDEMNVKAVGQMEMERKLRLAIAEEEFTLHYQPQINLATGEVEGVEALLRWPTSGKMISPAEFIPVAEELGFMPQLGEWVLGKACLDIKHLNEITGRQLKVAINISVSQFKESSCLVDQVQRALASADLSPASLEIEITESMLIEDIASTNSTLGELRSLGVTLAIDDFGTGYSSLSYLSKLPVDILKIDRSFVQDIESNEDGGVIVTTIIALGHQLKMRVLAEGIETRAQLEKLKEWRCDSYQGYYFSKPIPLNELEALLVQKDQQFIHHG